MRPVRTAIRFMAAIGLAASLFAAFPAAATSAPAGVAPAPSRQPSFDRSQQSGIVVSRLRIPAIGLDETIRSGVALSVIDRGVAHWAGTSEPGGLGNVCLLYTSPSPRDRTRSRMPSSA